MSELSNNAAYLIFEVVVPVAIPLFTKSLMLAHQRLRLLRASMR